MLGPLSIIVCRVTAPVTRRLAKESGEGYVADVSRAARSRTDLLVVALAWFLFLFPWFIVWIAIDLLGVAMGQVRGWTGPVLLSGLAAAVTASVYYFVRAHYATERLAVRRSEDLLPVVVFVTLLVVASRSAG